VTIVTSPTNENGPGNVVFFYGATVYCNSGRTGLFGTNFTLQDWLNRFADKHGGYYFALPEPSPGRLRIPETEEKVRKSQQTETFSSLRFAREYRRLKPRIDLP
jgi:hypothetical protein